ncbi:MAG: hypothetical protein MJZ94_07685 [Bacteroidales bacterium]|nr:hypothetical protein [Bacteroidales bacterium]
MSNQQQKKGASQTPKKADDLQPFKQRLNTILAFHENKKYKKNCLRIEIISIFATSKMNSGTKEAA